MDLKTTVMIFTVILSATMLFFFCYFGNRFLKMSNLLLDDAENDDDLHLRLQFIKKTTNVFAYAVALLFTEIILLCGVLFLYN